jgi:type VI secretion system protein ImpJ
MALWPEVHWSEGMFLRPHHLQSAQRRIETLLSADFGASRSHGWGFQLLQVAKEPLENNTLRLDQCAIRMPDGTWVSIPDNTEVEPLNIEGALEANNGQIDVLFGVPQLQQVRPNTVPLEEPGNVTGSPRFEPRPLKVRDENTGENAQTIYVRRIRGKLFVAGEDTTGYETVRVGTVQRSDRPGAVPEMAELGAGPLLSIQADVGLSSVMTALAEQVDAKNEVMAGEAREHYMTFTDGVASNMEHLFKLHVLNGIAARTRALLQGTSLHPYDVFVALCETVGNLSIFSEELIPGVLPAYDHNRPGAALGELRNRISLLLEAIRPHNYVARQFARAADAENREGLELELDRAWIDNNLEMFIALSSDEMDIQQLEQFVYGRMNLKLASPQRAPKIYSTAVRGLRLQVRSVPAGTLPRRQGLYYFKIDKALGPDRVDYWRECESERGIRISIQEGQLAHFEQLQPTLYVITQRRS